MLAYRTRLKIVASTLLAGGLLGCSLLLDLPSATQCSKDGDPACTKLGLTCNVAQKVCIQTPQPDTGTSSGEGGPPPPDCSTNQECTTRLGEPAVCLKIAKRCQKLNNPDANCKLVSQEGLDDKGQPFKETATAPPYLDNDAVIFGTYSGYTDDSAATMRNGAILAWREINRYAGGLPGSGGSSKPRPIVVVDCHFETDTDQNPKGFNHFVSLEIPAIVGPENSGDLGPAANRTIPAGMFMIGTFSQSPVLTVKDDQGLLWRPTPSGLFQAPPIRALAGLLEARVRKDLSLGATPSAGGNYVRIAAANLDNPFAGPLMQSILTGFKFNNGESDTSWTKSASRPLAAKGSIASKSNEAAFATSLYTEAPLTAAQAAPLRELEPHIDIFVGAGTETVYLPSAVVAGWTNANYLPYTIMNSNQKDGITTVIKSSPALAPRIYTVAFIETTDQYADFKQNFQKEFTTPPKTHEQFAYDAAYLLTYAYVGAGNVPNVTGADVARGMRKLTPIGNSSPIPKNVGPGDGTVIQSVFAALKAGGVVDLQGASGPLDLDPETGEPSQDSTFQQVWCIGPLPDAGSPLAQYTGVYWDATKKKFLVGTGVPNSTDPDATADSLNSSGKCATSN